MTEPNHKSIVIDKDGNPWGPFENGIKAAEWAKQKWPDQQQVPDSMSDVRGWDVWALWPPD